MWLHLPNLERALQTETIGRRLVYLTSTSSTMDAARAEAEAGEEHGTIVFAEEQSAGRGRFGREWLSPAGKNIYVTIMVRPSVEQLRRLGIITPLAVALAIEEATGLSPRIKWPNDVLLSGRKTCGILIESELSGSDPRYALIGIGINVNFEVAASADIAAIATSISQELGRETEREPVLAALLNHFEALYESRDADAALEAWKARLETLGRDVHVTFRDEVYEGSAEDVDEQGRLIVRLPDGSLQTFEAGEVSLRPPER